MNVNALIKAMKIVGALFTGVASVYSAAQNEKKTNK